MTSDPARLYIGDKVAWDGSSLVVTDPELLSRLAKPYLSASTAKALHGCQASWAGERALPDAFDLFSATEKGSAAHLVLEELYQLPPERRDAKHAAAILTDLPRRDPQDGEVDYAAALGTDPVRYTQWIAMVTGAYQGIFDIEDPKAVDVYATELRLDGIEVGGVPFKGFIDRIDYADPDKQTLFVRDYKTGRDRSQPNPRFDDDHGDQIRLYYAALQRWLAEQGYPELKVTGGGLYYIEHGTKRDVDVRPTAVRKTLAGFADSWRLLQQTTETARFEAKPSPLCGWCPLVNSCPVARPARKDNDPRRANPDGIPQAVDLGIPTLRKKGTQVAPTTAPAAHTEAGRNTSDTTTSEVTMAHNGPWRETKPWDVDGGRVDGHLMMAAPHATAVIGMASLAAETLEKYRIKATPTTLRVMTSLLAKVVLDAQASITNGSTDWGEGSNTRVRGALRTVLDLRPLPLPETDGERDASLFAENIDALKAWQQRAATFATALVRTGIDLFDGNIPLDFADLLSDSGQGKSAA